MRALPLMLALAATPAFGQTGAASPNSTAGMIGGAGSVPQLGQPPAPLGTTTTLSERIDAAAGLDSRRAIITGTAGSLRPNVNRTTGNTLPGSAALESAGRPAGTPLGTGAVGTPAIAPPVTTPSVDPRNPG